MRPVIRRVVFIRSAPISRRSSAESGPTFSSAMMASPSSSPSSSSGGSFGAGAFAGGAAAGLGGAAGGVAGLGAGLDFDSGAFAGGAGFDSPPPLLRVSCSSFSSRMKACSLRRSFSSESGSCVRSSAPMPRALSRSRMASSRSRPTSSTFTFSPPGR